MTNALLVWCSWPNSEQAEAAAKHLVEHSLAACVNLSAESTSVYRWENALDCARETLMQIKTTTQSYAVLEQTLLELHPYECPEIIATRVERGLPAYVNWINENCTS